MPERNTSKGNDALDRITALEELMQRDCLGQQLTNVLRQLSDGTVPQHEQSALTDRINEYRQQLCQKYNVRGIYIPDIVLQGAAQRFVDAGQRCWFLTGREALVSSTTNWVLPGTLRFVHYTDSTGQRRSELQTPESHPLPLPGQPPLLTVQIDLSTVTQHDLERIASEVKKLVRTALRSLPRDVYTDHSTDLSELRFLRVRSKVHFSQDLRRYDLYMSGRTYHQIADLEAQGQRRRPSEDSIEKSIRKIYLAIHRKPPQSRRRRLDAPAEGMEVYACPEHPAGDCTEQCPYLSDYKKRFDATAPGPNSGMGRRAMSLADYKEPEDSSHKSSRRKSRLHRRQRP